ncbi:MAG: hypothetical protein ACOCTT_03540 [archaeon]
MSERQQLYLGGRSGEVWRNLKPVIKKEYENTSKFFQNLILAYDGKGAIEARIKMKKAELQKYKNKIKELKAEIKGLEEELENGDFEELTMSMDSDPREHPQWDKAQRIISDKISRGDIRLRYPKSWEDNNKLVYWSKTIGISKKKLLELVTEEMGEKHQEVLREVEA